MAVDMSRYPVHNKAPNTRKVYSLLLYKEKPKQLSRVSSCSHWTNIKNRELLIEPVNTADQHVETVVVVLVPPLVGGIEYIIELGP